MEHLDLVPTEELVTRYAEAAKKHGKGTVTGSHPANLEADVIAAVYRELRRRGSESALLRLLASEECRALGQRSGMSPERAAEDTYPLAVEDRAWRSDLGRTASEGEEVVDTVPLHHENRYANWMTAGWLYAKADVRGAPAGGERK